MGGVRLETDDPPPAVATQAAPRPPAPRRALWPRAIGIVIVAAALAGFAAFVAWTFTPAPRGVVTRFTIPIPDGQQFTNTGRRLLAVAPDATNIAYVAHLRLVLRTMRDEQARPNHGSDT